MPCDNNFIFLYYTAYIHQPSADYSWVMPNVFRSFTDSICLTSWEEKKDKKEWVCLDLRSREHIQPPSVHYLKTMATKFCLPVSCCNNNLSASQAETPPPKKVIPRNCHLSFLSCVEFPLFQSYACSKSVRKTRSLPSSWQTIHFNHCKFTLQMVLVRLVCNFAHTDTFTSPSFSGGRANRWF